jgi:hypothetical protein
VVAALTHFPTSNQRAKVIKFSNDGNAAITQNCPLHAVAAITFNLSQLSVISVLSILLSHFQHRVVGMQTNKKWLTPFFVCEVWFEI